VIGRILSHYQVLEKIGEGGMGEVYLAKDTKLDREVAIKVLPAHLADNPELRRRFEREARAVSSLNHPHVCTLHDIGEQDGVDYLVMEYIEGETLADRLKKGALPLDQALRYAIEIANALDKADRAGLVHRDLKPGNIMLTKAGAKLLDFGLAKLRAGVSAETPSMLSALPTEEKPLTEKGSILGTLQYMAPEQLQGKEADARTDIFAFGTTLYEMVTGRKAFEGKSQASLIAAILEHEPTSIIQLQPMSPPILEHIVKTCMAKDPDERWQTAGDLERQLKWIAGGDSTSAIPSADIVTPGLVSRRRSIVLALTTLVVGAIIGVIAVLTLRLAPQPEPRPVIRFSVALPPHRQLQGEGTHSIALSPNGHYLIYVAGSGDGRPQLYLRSMGSLEDRPLAGTEDATNPFFSPDSQWVGFYAAGQLKKISTQGGAPVIICGAPSLLGGASWGSDDTIVFAPISGVGLMRVPASGGTPEVLTTLDSEKGEISHRWPHVLPGGKAVLFNAAGGPNWDQWPIVAQSLETGERRVVAEAGTDARYSPRGHIMYVRAGTLMAMPFDLQRLEVAKDAVPVLEGVRTTSEGAAEFGLSELGSLVYIPGPVGEAQRSLVFLDRNGKEEPLAAPRRQYDGIYAARLSPDGRRIAATIRGDNSDVWVYDIPGQTLTRLTFEGNNQFPIWTPNGNRITFRATRRGLRNLWWKPADGSGSEKQLTKGKNLQTPLDWSPDGLVLLYFDSDPATGADIWALSLDGEREAQAFIQTPYAEEGASFSPDGHWLAIESDESGRSEIYVQPFPGPGKKWTISTEGGRFPVWAQNGELFYVNGNNVMVVDILTKPTFRAGRPQTVFSMSPSFQTDGNFTFDVTPDGQRFLMVKQSELELPATKWNIVLNWFEELERLVPTN
jgi:serine/threonine-protein kinase